MTKADTGHNATAGLTMGRTEKIRRALSGPYFFSFLFISAGYLLLNGMVNKTITNNFAVLKTYSFAFLIPYLILNFLVAILTGITINLAVLKIGEWRELRKTRIAQQKTGQQNASRTGSAGGAAAAGIFTGLLGGACPGCFIGLFPAVMGLFGISASLGVLPFYGLELQIGSAVMLAGAVVLLTRDAICRI